MEAATSGSWDRDADRALADAVLGGDRDAFRVLVEREATSVLAACQRILGDRAESEDAAQDAFLLAYRKLGAYRGDGPLGGWLMRIAIREARDRAIRRRPTAALEADTGTEPGSPAHAHGADPGDVVVAGERRAQVRSAVERLPTHLRDAVRLRYLDGWSFEEIAAATGRPEPTVRTHVHRGLVRLRGIIDDEVHP